MTTALRDAIDFTALGWIKPELDETLRQARLEIEAYAEDPDDAGRMQACATLMHQVQGSLRMLELYAPAMVGDTLTFRSRVTDVTEKKGGAMTLIAVVTEITRQDGVHIADTTRTIVVRNPKAA